MFKPLLESIPHTDAEIARSQFELYGHVSIQGLFNDGLLEPALEDVRNLTSLSRTHNEGQRENVTQLRMPDPEGEESLYAVLQGAQEGVAILGGALSLTRGCQLDLRQMDRGTQGPHKRNRLSLVGGVVATISLEGTSYFALRDREVDEDQDTDYLVKPGDIVFESLAKRLIHRSYTGDEARTSLTIANNIQALAEAESQTAMPRRETA